MLARTYAAVQDSCIEKDRGYSGKVYGYSVQSTEFLHDGLSHVEHFVEHLTKYEITNPDLKSAH